MSFVVTAQLLDERYTRKISWALGTIDLFITGLSIEHLMHKSGPVTTNTAGAAHAETYKLAAATPAAGTSKGSDHGAAGPAVIVCIGGGGAESSIHSAVSPANRIAAIASSNGHGVLIASAQLEPREAPTPVHNGFMAPLDAASLPSPHSAAAAIEMQPQPPQQPQ